MGFLSKLFGGDAEDEPRSTEGVGSEEGPERQGPQAARKRAAKAVADTEEVANDVAAGKAAAPARDAGAGKAAVSEPTASTAADVREVDGPPEEPAGDGAEAMAAADAPKADPGPRKPMPTVPEGARARRGARTGAAKEGSSHRSEERSGGKGRGDRAATAPFKSRRAGRSPGYYSSLAPDRVTLSSSGGLPKKANQAGVSAPVPGSDKTFTPPPSEATADVRGSKAQAQAKRAPATAVASPRRAPLAAAEAAPSRLPLRSPPAGARASDADEERPEESEKTSPGVGTSKSRHDPEVLGELPAPDLRLLGEFVVDLALGPASERWLVPIRRAVTALSEAATKAQRSELAEALSLFLRALEGDGELSGERRTEVLHRFVAIDTALPRPFGVVAQKEKREQLIVEQLVSQVDGLHALSRKRLSDEGLMALDGFVGVQASDLAERLGLGSDLAERLVSTFQGYMLERCQRGPDVALQGAKDALRERLGELESASKAFQQASEGDDSAARRETRRHRLSRVARVNLLLAELGEATLLEQVERCSVQAKVERLQRWLEEEPAS